MIGFAQRSQREQGPQRVQAAEGGLQPLAWWPIRRHMFESGFAAGSFSLRSLRSSSLRLCENQIPGRDA